MNRDSTRQVYSERILRVLSYIQGHLGEAISPHELAAIAHCSPHHFHRIFRGMVGESVMGHVRRLRLERAAWSLKFGDHPVTRIAFDAGYENHESFTRAFGAMFGTSPSAFRESQRRIRFPDSPSGVHYDPDGPAEFVSRTSDVVVEVRRVPPRRVVFIRHVGPYRMVGETWDELMAFVATEGLMGSGEILGLCYDDPEITAEDRIRYDAALVIGDASVDVRGNIGVSVLAGGEYATFRHVGPYHEIGEAYHALIGGWLPGSGREAEHTPTVEQYFNDPDSTLPEELDTEVSVLLRTQGE